MEHKFLQSVDGSVLFEKATGFLWNKSEDGEWEHDAAHGEWRDGIFHPEPPAWAGEMVPATDEVVRECFPNAV